MSDESKPQCPKCGIYPEQIKAGGMTVKSCGMIKGDDTLYLPDGVGLKDCPVYESKPQSGVVTNFGPVATIESSTVMYVAKSKYDELCSDYRDLDEVCFNYKKERDELRIANEACISRLLHETRMAQLEKERDALKLQAQALAEALKFYGDEDNHRAILVKLSLPIGQITDITTVYKEDSGAKAREALAAYNQFLQGEK